MAVLQMQRICICALKKDRKHILEFLQRRGAIELFDEIEEDTIFQKKDVSLASSILEKAVHSSKEALRILEEHVPEKKEKLAMMKGREVIDVTDYKEFAGKRDSLLQVANSLIQLEKSIAENKAEILRFSTQVELIRSWMELDLPTDFKGTKSTSAFIGTLPGEWNIEMLYEKLSEFEKLAIDIVSTSKSQTNIFVVSLKEQAEAVNDRLREMGFSFPSIQSTVAPSELKKELEQQIEKTSHRIEELEQNIAGYVEKRDEIRFLQDYDTMRLDKYFVLGRLLQSERVFVMTGFLPKENEKEIEDGLNESFDLVVTFEDPKPEDNVPVKLKNNSFCAPLEGTLASYSLPGKGEMDPTMVMSLFYYVLFGLMLSDAGYGIIMVVACGVCLLKFKNTLEDSLKKSLQMFFYCGISTTFWGVMFGSYFGDIVDTFSATFLGYTAIIPPVWFFPVKDPMRMLVFSMAIGVVHLYTGLAMKAYQCIKGKDIKGLIYDVIFWYLLLSGSIVLLMSISTFTNTLGLDFILSKETGNVAGIVALIGALGILVTNGRESRNPFKRFLKGLYALYGITGYLSDVLSYSRLLALGLATGVICTVINKMASMTANGPLGIVFFAIVVIFGHILNLGINALGAYVHTTRLQYVEFFGKFYEGGGRGFDPFKVNTKYYKFKEK